MTTVVRTPAAWGKIQKQLHLGDHTLGFVPTMGALHEGHTSLINRSVAENTDTVVSIFVNATQFDSSNDLAQYPRDLDRDLSLLSDCGVQFAFVPDHEDLYPDGYRFTVTEKELSTVLCGAHRPGHFDGVLTVVAKLLNLVQPDRAYFGEKDYQQYLLVRDMAEALFIPVEIVPCEIVRDSDGLALSSRNVRLSQAARELAVEFAKTLRDEQSKEGVTKRLSSLGIDVDYVEELGGRRLAAVTINGIRLIDNVKI